MRPTVHHPKIVLNAYGPPSLPAINSRDSKVLTQLSPIKKLPLCCYWHKHPPLSCPESPTFLFNQLLLLRYRLQASLLV